MTRTRAQERLGEALIKANVIDQTQLKSALARVEQWGGRLPKTLADMGFADEDVITTQLASALRVPLVQLERVSKDMQALKLLSASYCEEHAVYPVAYKNHTLLLAMADPTELNVVDEVAAKTNARVQVHIASETHIAETIAANYRGQHLEHHSNPALRAVRRLGELAAEEGASGDLAIDDETHAPIDPVAMLEQMLGSTTDQLSPEVLARIEAARLNQEKVAHILGVLTELLTEQGLLPLK